MDHDGAVKVMDPAPLPKAAAARKNYCFTRNNWTPADKKLLAALEVDYIVFGEEIAPTTGTPHLQGYVQLTKKMRWNTLAKKLPGFHIQAAYGTPAENYAYCTKGDKFYEKGKMVEIGKTNVKSMYEAYVACDGDQEVMMTEYGDKWLRNKRGLMEHDSYMKGQAVKKTLRDDMEKAELRDWQKEVVRRLDEQDNRKILFVVDFGGNQGKSFLADYLYVTRGAFVTTGGKCPDIAYMYKSERLVVFDMSRSGVEFLNYNLVEQFKNSFVSSTKYESCMKPSRAKVCVMMNCFPDRSKLSDDRYDVMELNVI